MKKTILASVGMALVLALAAIPQSTGTKHHRVVFEVNSGPEAWDQVMGNIENMRKAFAPEPLDVEVVCFGKGLDLVVAAKTTVKDRMTKLSDGGVKFMACQNSMRVHKVTTPDLVPFAGQVPSGAAEVVRKQEEGWAYLKSGE